MVLLAPAIAEAHRPVFVGAGALRADRAHPITEPDISWAIYGRLEARGARQYFSVRGQAGSTLFLQLLVPADRRATFVPELRLSGPGIGSPGSTGMMLRSSASSGRTFHERFTQVTYWEYPAHRIPLPRSGTYLVEVSLADGAPGPYVLAVGTREVFGAADLLRFPAWWWSARRHAGEPVWYGPMLLLLVLGSVIFVIVRAARALRRRRG